MLNAANVIHLLGVTQVSLSCEVFYGRRSIRFVFHFDPRFLARVDAVIIARH